MNAADQPMDESLGHRLDALQLRVEYLESLLTEAVDVDPEPTPVDDGPVPRASVDHDLRELQRAATDSQAQILVASTQPFDDSAIVLPVEDVLSSNAAAETDSPSQPKFDLAYVEERLAGRVLALVGGAALILGAVFFLSLAFSRGWIGPSLQVGMGLAGGSIALLLGGVLLMRGDRIVGHVLTAVGLAVISLAFFAATTLYGLVPPVVGLAGTLGAAAVATAIAVTTRSQVVAGFGLVAVLAAPPILGAPADTLTLAYMVVVLSGVAAVAVRQTWSWLPVIAFALSAPQVWAWIASDPSPQLGFAALLLYWVLLAIATGGEAFRYSRPELPMVSAPLFMLSGAFVVLMAFELLSQTGQQVAFLLTLAMLHGTVATFFALRRGPVDPFGLLAAAYGIALASAAIPLLFGASLTAAIWSAEAAALAVLAGRRAHGPSLIGALVLLALGGVGIAASVIEAQATRIDPGVAAIGSIDAILVSWAFYVLISAVVILAVPERTVRLTVVAMGALLSTLIVYYQLDGVAAVAGWTVVALLSVTSPRWLPLLPERHLDWQLGPALDWLRPTRPMTQEAALLPLATAGLAGGLALVATIGATAVQTARPDLPFTDSAGISALIVAGGALIAGLLAGEAEQRRYGIIATGAIVAGAVLFQVPLVWAVVAWVLGAAGAFWLGRADSAGVISYLVAGGVGLAAAGAATLLIAPPDRLIVAIGGVPPHPPFISEPSLALGAIAIGMAAVAILHPRARWSDGALAGAGLVGLYLLSVGVVDVFAGEAFGPPRSAPARVAELAKEAQVALSVLWTVVGVAVMAAGLVLKRSALRVAGLAVLALATAKVFMFDLAALDIAYRVITLMVLGVLLIASALAWTRFKSPTTEPGR